MKINENGRLVCEVCDTILFRNDKHDAYYCPKCDEWAEGNCGEPNCEYCVGRPNKPSEAK